MQCVRLGRMGGGAGGIGGRRLWESGGTWSLGTGLRGRARFEIVASTCVAL